MTSSAPILQLEGFGVAFGDKRVLRRLDLALPPAGCTVLLGPSGTGKSTLLRTLAGFNQGNPSLRTWGHALYRGAPCDGEHRPALVMQNSRLLVSNTFENLVCELPDRANLTRARQMERVSALLHDMRRSDLLNCLDQRVAELPPVQQRAISVLRLAMAAPELLMVDEPTTGLPPAQAEAVLDLIGRLSRRMALFVVLHNLQQARSVADRVVLLANGIVAAEQSSPQFFESPQGETARAFVATGSCPEDSYSYEASAPAATAAEAAMQPQPAQAAPQDRPAAAEPAAPVRAAISAACGPRGFLWLLPGQLAGTPWPGIVHGAAYDLDALRAVGVTRLVSLTEQPFDASLAAAYAIRCSASPMPDMQPPTMEQALDLCRHVDAWLAAGEVIAVHCHAGLGRTGTVLAAYWLWRGRGGIGAVKALEHVRRIEPGWVQSAAQVKFLEGFALVAANRRGAGSASQDPAAVIDAAVAA